MPIYPLLTGPLTVGRVTVPIVDLPAHLSGTRVVQLSDFHFDGLRLPPPLLQAAIAQCNALDPDLVVLTGDFVTKDPRPIYPLAEALSQLRSRHGVYAVLGNHDDVTPAGRRMIMDGLQQSRGNGAVERDRLPPGATLPYGRAGGSVVGSPASSDLIRPNSPRNPPAVAGPQPRHRRPAGGLTGWICNCRVTPTAGKSCCPAGGRYRSAIRRLRPYFPGWVRRHVPYLSDRCDRVTLHWQWASGLHAIPGAQDVPSPPNPGRYLYVNRGLGTYLPGRWRCPPEVTLLTLVANGDWVTG
jgi:hypothetical protein